MLAVQALVSRLYLPVVLSSYIASYLRSAEAKTVPRSWLDSNRDPTAASELIFDRLSGNCTPFRTAATGSFSLESVSVLQSEVQPALCRVSLRLVDFVKPCLASFDLSYRQEPNCDLFQLSPISSH